nr:MAG: internal scaffolding protein [Microviridae sp.]
MARKAAVSGDEVVVEFPRPFIHTRYDYENAVVVDCDFPVDDPDARSKTLQSGAADADINVLMKRYEETGQIGIPTDDVSGRKPFFGDFSDLGDYHSILSRVAAANTEFMKLSASVRARFGNDPQAMLAFIADPVNVVEAVNLGLLPKSALPSPVAAEAPAGPAVVPAAAAPVTEGVPGV